MVQKNIRTTQKLIFDIDGTTLEQVLQNAYEQLQDDFSISEENKAELKFFFDDGYTIETSEQSVAIVHCTAPNFQDLEIIIRTKRPISLHSAKKTSIRFLWFLLGSEITHHHTAQASDFINMLKEASLKEQFLDVETDGFLELYHQSLERQVNFEHHIPDELRPTGKFAGGLLADINRTFETYVKDFTDGLNSKSLASIFFLFFACLAPAIAFGGLLEFQTNGAVGVTEMIVATAICGIIYSLFSGQPLTILGSTGPVIIFMGLLYPLCIHYHVPYLPTLACVGLWTMLFLIILALIDACSWIRFFTRFTDDTFAALISLIFIYEAVKKMLHGFTPDASGSVLYDTAFFALILALGTFYIASSLSSLRSGVYLRRRFREFLADFGTTIAIASMIFLSLFFKDIAISRLDVPEKLEPSAIVISDEIVREFQISQNVGQILQSNPSILNTSVDDIQSLDIEQKEKEEILGLQKDSKEEIIAKSGKRGWFVNPLDAPQWVIWMSIIPAILLSILLYLDQNITVRLVNHSQYKLQKGAGYHLDLFVVALLVGVCSLLGLPWMVAATVRSLNHVRSLVIVDNKDGEEVITGTVETRLTGLLVHVSVGASLLLLSFLKLVPMAVLFGLFLYMGIASMKGNQLFERIRLWIMDPAKYPATYYLRAVPTKQVHLFTFIQTVSLAILWIVKTSALAILFPLFIAFLVPVRMLLNRYFDHTHLALLDAEEEPDEEQNRENL